VSPWPKGSPFWYPTGTVTWVMEFDVGGYFLHDASWEPPSMFGPGSENTYVASHGCVHIPTPVMRWAYQWTPIGTPVIITL
jgi:lipoprotein-anchoring transpeptidase ErfK/SrfK